MEKLLILGAPVFQIEVVKKAKELGLYVGIVDINEDAPAMAYADETFVGSIIDFDGVLEVAKKFQPDGIISGACDTSVVTAAKVREALGLPGYSVETAIKATNKVEMLKAFEAHGVSHPLFQLVNKEDIDSFELSIPFPVITKPTDSAGGRGVSIVKSMAELRDALLFSSNAGRSGNVLVEEYMAGPEVSVEVLVSGGVAHVLQVTDKLTSGEPNFYEVGHSQPSALAQETKEKIKELAKAAVLSLGIDNSPAHVEIITTPEGPKMVELGARLGGDCITSFLIDNSVSGVNMTAAAILLAMGKTPDISNYRDSGKSVAIKFIPTKKGLLKEINNVEKASSMDGTIAVFITGKVGKIYEDATDDSARFGYVVCEGATTKEAMDLCDKAISEINFVLE